MKKLWFLEHQVFIFSLVRKKSEPKYIKQCRFINKFSYLNINWSKGKQQFVDYSQCEIMFITEKYIILILKILPSDDNVTQIIDKFLP